MNLSSTEKVFTDGEVPNIGETIEFVRKFNSNSRVFSLGIGAHASRLLVRGIARAGRGTAEFVEGDNDKSIYEAVERQMVVALSPALDIAKIGWGVSGDTRLVFDTYLNAIVVELYTVF